MPEWDGEPTLGVQDDDLTVLAQIWADEDAPSLGYSKERAIEAAEAFEKILFGESVNECQGFADVLVMTANRTEPEIARVRAALASAFAGAS